LLYIDQFRCLEHKQCVETGVDFLLRIHFYALNLMLSIFIYLLCAECIFQIGLHRLNAKTYRLILKLKLIRSIFHIPCQIVCRTIQYGPVSYVTSRILRSGRINISKPPNKICLIIFTFRRPIGFRFSGLYEYAGSWMGTKVSEEHFSSVYSV
jgi:hypothetical protein